MILKLESDQKWFLTIRPKTELPVVSKLSNILPKTKATDNQIATNNRKAADSYLDLHFLEDVVGVGCRNLMCFWSKRG